MEWTSEQLEQLFRETDEGWGELGVCLVPAFKIGAVGAVEDEKWGDVMGQQAENAIIDSAQGWVRTT
jgi:hypothetical protein